MWKCFFLFTILFLGIQPSLEAAEKKTSFLSPPHLVVVLVFDQMRADYLTRFSSRFLPAKNKDGVGGFRYL